MNVSSVVSKLEASARQIIMHNERDWQRGGGESDRAASAAGERKEKERLGEKLKRFYTS